MFVVGITMLLAGCSGSDSQPQPMPTGYSQTEPACPIESYPDLATSIYILPFETGQTFKTGLTNCSSSYHAEGLPNQFAFDFRMPIGTLFIAAHAGITHSIVEDKPSSGGDQGGNHIIINHGDGTYAMYLHSPKNGIYVGLGEQVEQGAILGETGQSGFAGYPHLHFMVTKVPYYPATRSDDGLAVSFKNVIPEHTKLQNSTEYTAGPL